jgi:hypothetical protein
VEQEAAEGLRIRKTGQAGQVLKCAVGTQERRGFPAIQAKNDWVDQGQYHLGQRVALVASGVGQMGGQEIAQLQHSQKFVKKVDTAEVRQARVITGDSNISRRIS